MCKFSDHINIATVRLSLSGGIISYKKLACSFQLKSDYMHFSDIECCHGCEWLRQVVQIVFFASWHNCRISCFNKSATHQVIPAQEHYLNKKSSSFDLLTYNTSLNLRSDKKYYIMQVLVLSFSKFET